MEIGTIVGLGLIATTLALVVKRERPEIAVLLSVATGVVVFLLLMDKIAAVVEVFTGLGERAGLNSLYLGIIFKIIGISYLAEFGAQICRDAGEGAIAQKIELAAKIMVIILAIPILMAVLETLLKLLPE
ncbi:stage III sporulation protein AD [Carboxydothermus pertinax]|uniref:Stage III sporulation protein AD n=1 Tax=Carboxydothermus pertinax TaxID=870242 RepID=A0A1L8CTY7_9THEO|nr:stage III sporulation protein AD [Carboxydothermus pertinax]GAV22376.1 stage III sporulation protein AD [Carboxydothermus pertinax]